MEKFEKIKKRETSITVIGMGYIGLPTAIAFAKTGFTVRGFDINNTVIKTLKEGESISLNQIYKRYLKKFLMKEN